MLPDTLTPDNPPLSRLNDRRPVTVCAINCTSTDLSELTRQLIQEGISSATKRAYMADIAHFERSGGVVPTSAVFVAEYLATYSESLSVATLHRRVAALAKVHRSRGFSDPTTAPVVKAVLRGIRRKRLITQRQAAPLVREELLRTLEKLGERRKDVRDRALLLLGFAGGFRRSELVGLHCQDIRFMQKGLEITIRHSKTDQEGEGRKIGIPYAAPQCCPVSAVQEWLENSGLKAGPVFRPIDRHQRIANKQLSGEAVCDIIRERVAAVGINPTAYSGHSLRAGFVTSAAQAGVPSWKIRQQTGHASDAMLVRYIRDAELFVDNAVSALL